MSGGQDPVLVATAPDSLSGSLLATALESAGIPVEVRGARQSWLYPGAQGGLGSVQLYVPAPLEADARAILDELEAGG